MYRHDGIGIRVFTLEESSKKLHHFLHCVLVYIKMIINFAVCFSV